MKGRLSMSSSPANMLITATLATHPRYAELEKTIRTTIQDVPNFPKEGILFRDLTPVFQNSALFQDAITLFAEALAPLQIQQIAGIESRGFIIGAPLALAMGAGFVPIRKRGKLPRATYQESYALEYGQDTLEIHQDAIAPGQRTLLVDDLLATGGTALATTKLIRKTGADLVGALFMVELDFLKGRTLLKDVPLVDALVHYGLPVA